MEEKKLEYCLCLEGEKCIFFFAALIAFFRSLSSQKVVWACPCGDDASGVFYVVLLLLVLWLVGLFVKTLAHSFPYF